MASEFDKIKKREKARRRLEAPARGKFGSRRGQNMTGCLIPSAEKKMVRLKRVRKPDFNTTPESTLDKLRNRVEVPDIKLGKQKIRVAEVQGPANTFGKRGSFYNPAHAISQAVQDALNPDKVLPAVPRQCEEWNIVPYTGVRITVARCLERREASHKYLLPNGRTLWVPIVAITDEGIGFIRVFGAWARRRAWIMRLPSKYGGSSKVMNPEAVKYAILQKRGKK